MVGPELRPGDVVNGWVILQQVDSRPRKWKAACPVCGGKKTVYQVLIVDGVQKDCGCKLVT